MPPGGWFYVQPETNFTVKTRMGFQLVEPIRQHRIANKLPRTEVEEVWQDIEAFTCNRLRGSTSLWDFCNVAMPRISNRRKRFPVNQIPAAVAQMPVRGKRTLPKRSTSVEVHRFDTVAELAPAAANLLKSVSATGKRPCKTCGKRKSG